MTGVRLGKRGWLLLAVLFIGMTGCSYHNDRGHDGYGGVHHEREDVYVHDDDRGPHGYHHD